MRTTSYLHPALYHIEGPSGRSVVSAMLLAKGTVLAVWGGTTYDAPSFFQLPPERRQISVQIEDHLFLVPEVEGPAEWINHSCMPNAGLSGQIVLVTLRDVSAGEEICYDYAMSDGSPYDEFECSCGAPTCRRRVTGNDWHIPELWDRYAGRFSPYLQRRIDSLQADELRRTGSAANVLSLQDATQIYGLTGGHR
jgi:uncharacterized protein